MSKQTYPANVLARKYEVGTTRQDYWEYLILSEENGQIRQLHQLFDKMNMHDKHDFIHWCQINKHYDALRSIAIHLL